MLRFRKQRSKFICMENNSVNNIWLLYWLDVMKYYYTSMHIIHLFICGMSVYSIG